MNVDISLDSFSFTVWKSVLLAVFMLTYHLPGMRILGRRGTARLIALDRFCCTRCLCACNRTSLGRLAGIVNARPLDGIVLVARIVICCVVGSLAQRVLWMLLRLLVQEMTEMTESSLPYFGCLAWNYSFCGANLEYI